MKPEAQQTKGCSMPDAGTNDAQGLPKACHAARIRALREEHPPLQFKTNAAEQIQTTPQNIENLVDMSLPTVEEDSDTPEKPPEAPQ